MTEHAHIYTLGMTKNLLFVQAGPLCTHTHTHTHTHRVDTTERVCTHTVDMTEHAHTHYR